MAITATVTATKVDITSTGGVQENWDACVTAVNAVSAGTILGTGTSGDPYEIKGDRELEISSGCKVKFVTDTYTKWDEITTSGRYGMDFVGGSEIVIEDGVNFDWSGSSAARIYTTHYGAITATGTSVNRIVFKGMSRNYFYNRSASSYTYVDITDNRYSTGYSAYFSIYSNTAAPDCSMSYVRFFNASGNNGYGLYFSGGDDFSNWTFDNIEVDGLTYAVIAYSSVARFTNSTFKNCVGQHLLYGAGNKVGNIYQTAQDDTTYPQGTFQPMMTFDTCTFQDMDLGAYSIYAFYNALVHLKDCTFIGDTYSGTQDGVSAGYGGRVIYSGTTTYTNIDVEKIWASNGTHLHARTLDLTVNDEGGSPLENATVSIIQQSATPKEIWTGTTNSDGNLLTMFDTLPVFVEKEETSTGVYENWSDGTGDLKHKILVAYPGYKVGTQDIEFTQDRTVTMGLSLEDTPSTVIYDSTINNSTIY